MIRWTFVALAMVLINLVGNPAIAQPTQTMGRVEVVDAAMKSLVDPDSKMEVLASGFQWSEGPVWWSAKSCLLFSDVPNNRIHRWDAEAGKSIFMEPSGSATSKEREPGSNGLAFDAQGRLLVCDHGNRRIYRVEADGTKTTLVDQYQGKRLNSPNDLVVHSSGDIFFTDPPYGLRDPEKRELDFCGVYRLELVGEGRDANQNKLTLISRNLERPNGIGLSPDEKTLYVAQSHRPAPTFTQFHRNQDGSFSEGEVLFDASALAAKDPGMPDGMTLDQEGRLWATGPGGVLVISPQGKLLGRLITGQPTANCAFGSDGSTLYITSGKDLLRIQTKVRGLGFDNSKK